MKIIHFKCLSKTGLEQISQIVEECRSLGSHLSFPFHEANSIYLLCDPEPVSVMALILPATGCEAEGAACTAFTRPGFRRRGYFFTLFKRALHEAKEMDLYFFADPADKGSMMTLQAIEADYLDSEHKMELSLESLLQPAPSHRICSKVVYCCPDDASEATAALFFSFYQNEPGAALALSKAKGSPDSAPIGSARVALYKDSACLYGFEILTAFRGKGYGRESLYLILKNLKGHGLNTLFLHVSESNTAAMSLYKEAGFRITETLSCYLY